MVVKMEQKDMNNLSPAELKAMADALLAADDAKQAETKAAPAADEPAEDKPVAEKPESEKTTEEKLNELVEKGKKAGKLSSKDLMVLEDMNLSSEETEKFYDRLESLGPVFFVRQDLWVPGGRGRAARARGAPGDRGSHRGRDE